VPATLTGAGQESTSGTIHMILAWAAMALVGIHALAAIKHHVWDKSHVLTRMWSGPFSKSE
jgi:cytochrome b561